ncbi:thermonuclease [Lysinibacillus yapensis]|uniref:Thermonuclease n=1 Tax=Ureibacillus yapensis TaxID=2304605 RepID=A0A396SKE8_9BACL|nr:thermonuclease family protein [Lysinibacillus yapensis]RHW39839.1 thermonuclease [Lysinibacillus yapensis]
MFKKILPLLCLTLFLGACNINENLPIEEHFARNGIADTEIGGTHDVTSFEEYPLVNVIDGDTIKIKYNGSNESVRFLLVDTPETNHETLGEQPYGQEAKAFTKALLEGQETVYLEFDVSYRDKYKRLLAYVYTADGKSVQEELLKNGLARVAYIYEPNTKHVDWFEAVQKQARKQEIGIWSVENYATARGYDKKVFEEKQTEENHNSKSSCTIKGNINSRGKKIYHSPGQQNYESTNPEELFCSAKEAEAAGYKAAPN